MKKEINFTKKTLQELTAPKKGRAYFKDSKTNGLSLYITPNGTMTFFIRRRVHGRDERIILGGFPEMSVEMARKKSLIARAKIAEGENPNEAKQRLRNDMTFKEMFDRYINDYAKHHTASWKHDIEDVERNLKHWYNRKASTITHEEVRKLHANFGANRGKAGAGQPPFYGPVLG